MRVLNVQLRDFRTYERARAALGEGLTIVHGPNAAGKSNLLEALYFGCTGHSPRTRNERELVRFGAKATRVVVALEDEGREHELSVGYGSFADGEPAIKRMRADGAPVERLLEVQARPLVSVFMPDRLELLKGSPALRRAHIDALIAALWPLRTATRRSYQGALAQRNALLGRIRSGAAAQESIRTWDVELARHALALREDRAAAVALLLDPFARRCRQLGLGEQTRIEYRPRTRAGGVEELLDELASRLSSDLDRGFTTHGPHRDELAIVHEGRELRTYGSQGERRLALLALLLAERSVLADERRSTPLMLLDDVMSELDAERRELLATELASGEGQSVIATTDLDHVPGAEALGVARLRVSAGTVVEEALAA